jgi:hypothetical protein
MLCRDLRLRRVAVSCHSSTTSISARDDAARAARHLDEVPARLGAGYLELRPRMATSPRSLPRAEPRHTRNAASAAAPRGRGEALAAWSNHRNHVRYRRGSFRTEIEGSDVAEFFGVYSARQKELGTPVPSPEFYRAVRAAFPDRAVVLSVRESERNRVVAGMFLLGSGDTLHYLWGGGDVAYNRLHVNAFMYWEAIRHGIARGYRWLDLGRSPRVRAQRNDAFKMQFGVEPLPLTCCRVGSAASSGSQQGGTSTHCRAAAVWKHLPDA